MIESVENSENVNVANRGGGQQNAAIQLLQNSQLNPAIERLVPINSASASSSIDLNSPYYLHQLKSDHQIHHLKEEVAEMGAVACWALGDWEQMRKFVDCLPETSYDGALNRCVLALSTNVSLLNECEDMSKKTGCDEDNYDPRRVGCPSIMRLIEQARDLLDADLTTMATQSYERSYQAIVEAQVLAELEEIVVYKRMPDKRDGLIRTWWKRLQGTICNLIIFKLAIFSPKSPQMNYFTTNFKFHSELVRPIPNPEFWVIKKKFRFRN